MSRDVVVEIARKKPERKQHILPVCRSTLTCLLEFGPRQVPELSDLESIRCLTAGMLG